VSRSVVIFGGGVGGLSAAHELVERGFAVTVHESRALGGKARSIYTDGLPGEHGMRYFPRFYRHLPDTMARIPAGEGTVADRLVPLTEARLLWRARPGRTMASRFPRTAREIPAWWPSYLWQELGFSAGELAFFGRQLFRFLTSCDERRLDEYEGVTFYDVMEPPGADVRYEPLARSATYSLVAMDARRASARTIFTTAMQTFGPHYVPRRGGDRVLDGPTDAAWIQPWTRYLEGRGVRFVLGSRLERLRVEAGRIQGAMTSTGLVTADHYVAAVPAERMAEIVCDDVLAAAPALAGIAELDVEWMIGAQYFLSRDVPLAHGHVILADSPWALTLVSHPQFWRAGALPEGVRGLLSVCLSSWDAPGTYCGKPARDCTPDELLAEVWQEILAHTSEVRPGDLVRAVLADSLEVGPDGKTGNREPLLINTVDSWRHRPDAITAIPNLFLASDYVRGHTDLATMEGANEAARRAVNGILERTGSTAPRCRLWPLRWSPVWEPLRWLDRRRHRQGRRHFVD
jgi:15-cis-phytoene desaturase